MPVKYLAQRPTLYTHSELAISTVKFCLKVFF